MSVKMTRYKQADFADEDTSSIGSRSIHLNEATTIPSMHIRYHTTHGVTLWRTRTKLEKYLIVAVCVISIAFIVFLLCARSSEHSRAQYLLGTKPCLQEPCIHAASEMLNSIDQHISPCDDFYGFACNRWIKNNPIPDGKSMWGTFGKLEQRNQLVIKNVLERPITMFKSKAEKKAKLYYESCLDENELIEKAGAKPMLKLIYDVGGWNVTSNSTNRFNVTTWSFEQTLKVLQNKYNMGGLFGWAVGEDDRNSSRHIIQIDQGGLTLPTKENYINKTAHAKILSAYLDYMVKVAVLLGANDTEATKQMQAVIDFETKLAEITASPDERRDEELLYHPMTLKELQEKAPLIDWRAHFEDALRIVKRKVTEKERVVVYAPEYLIKLTVIVKDYNASDDGKIVLNNYLLWQTVRSFTACLSKPFRDAYKGLRKALIGSDGGEEPWRYCVSDTNNAIGFAIGAMFVREVFNGEAKPQAENMINSVRLAFKDNLKNLQWMDAETRILANEKADAISDMIGFPDYILNPQLLDERYKMLEIDPNNYFENNVKLNVFNLKKNLEKLDQPVNKTKWGMTPTTVNAYYTPTKNQIVFPAGILQLPFYDITNPKSLNFGGMGVVMGHELTHAFDDQGREYNAQGNLHQWWNNKTIERFKERANCFVNQYNKYEINGKHLNGKQTLGENIADNGGLKAAYNAYIRTKMFDEIDTYPLPGINMTHRQLFFVSFAQVWCSAVTDETTNLQIEKDPHSPPKFRVIGSLSNLKEFSQEFNCPTGSPMNPLDKCEMW